MTNGSQKRKTRVAQKHAEKPAAAEAPQQRTGVQTLKVEADEAGMRLDRWFKRRFPGLALSHLAKIARKGEVRVDGKRVDTATRLEEGQAVRVQIWDAPEARGEGKALDIPWPGIVSARFVGEDDACRFYIQTERLEDDRVVLEVLAFSATGERLAVIQMPENDYAIWTAKLVDVRGDGALVALLPQQDQAKLNLFTY